MSRSLAICVFVSCLLAGCVADDAPAPGGSDGDGKIGVLGGGGGGGGAVSNVAPTIASFVADATTGPNDGSFTVTFTGAARDGNGESNVNALALAATGAGVIASTHTVTTGERAATSEPGSFGGDGWKVWTGSNNRDGVLQFKFRHTVPRFAQSGAYAFVTTVTDAANAAGLSGTVTVTVESFALVEIASYPVLANGQSDTTTSWGGWTANPDASNVASTNYLKMTNSGDQATQRVFLDFSASTFVGASDANDTIPIDGNIQFAVWEDTSPSSTSPSEGTFTYGATSNQASVTIQFTGRNNVIYVQYRLVDLPEILSAQSYTATFTATEI